MTRTASSGNKPKSIWQRINWLLVAVAITVVYVGWLLYSIGYSRIVTFLHDKDTDLNQVGDFLAGAFAPIALIWLVAAVLTQRQELNETRDQFELSHDAINRQLDNGKIATDTQIALAYETASANYKFSLFDKRVAAFNKLVTAGRTINFKGELPYDAIKSVIEAVNESKLIFSGSIANSVAEIEEAVLDYLRLDHDAPALPPNVVMAIPDEETERWNRHVKEKEEHLKRIGELLKYKRLNDIFVPNLKLPGDIERPKSVTQQ